MKLRAGESTKVIIPVMIGKGYHIQANPASNEFLVPMELKLKYADGIQYGSPDYPAGRSYRLAGTEEDLMTYEGAISVAVNAKILATASHGERLVKGSLSYQACDSRRCFFPTAVPLAFKVLIHK